MLTHNRILSNYIYKELDINCRRLNYIIRYCLLTKCVFKLSTKRSSIAYSKNTLLK